jgi:2,3-bisphosphoglycerate-independent phosphoglycerate mutase
MKHVLIIPDGFADRPLEVLKGRTPIEAAQTPAMDTLAREGEVGVALNIPKGLDAGSDVACMSLLGYDPLRYHTGRAPLEAVSLGVELGENEVAFRANLVTVAEGVMVDYSAGHIKSREAAVLVQSVREAMQDLPVRLYAGVSYRNLLVTDLTETADAHTVPPHDITGQLVVPNLPSGPGSDLLREVMSRSATVLAGHEVNEVRLSLGENTASMLWLWGGGRRPRLEPFAERYGASGAMISAVDLLRSLGMLMGFEILKVPGATGYLDTDYAAKGEYACQALEDHDLVVVHVEAPDEASHGGKALEKLKSLERIDQEIVAPVAELADRRGDTRIMVAADHATPIAVRTHTADPVPFLLWGPGFSPNGAAAFSEAAAKRTKLVEKQGWKLMGRLLGVEAQG